MVSLRMVYPIVSIVISTIHVDVLECALVHQEAVVIAIPIIEVFAETMVVVVVVLVITLE
jgi:hypothetical protein